VSRYLLMQTIINTTFGGAVAGSSRVDDPVRLVLTNPRNSGTRDHAAKAGRTAAEQPAGGRRAQSARSAARALLKGRQPARAVTAVCSSRTPLVRASAQERTAVSKNRVYYLRAAWKTPPSCARPS
jgi:hypothetical protein